LRILFFVSLFVDVTCWLRPDVPSKCDLGALRSNHCYNLLSALTALPVPQLLLLLLLLQFNIYHRVVQSDLESVSTDPACYRRVIAIAGASVALFRRIQRVSML